MRRYENERHNGDGTYNDCFWKKKKNMTNGTEKNSPLNNRWNLEESENVNLQIKSVHYVVGKIDKIQNLESLVKYSNLRIH